MFHQPVLTREIITLLQPERGGVFLDATAGTGGHTLALLSRGDEKIQLFALDRDRQSLEVSRHRTARFSDKSTFIHGNFAELKTLLPTGLDGKFDGILYDLGLSSFLLSESRRGFSFLRDETLDMRFDPGEECPTARQLLKHLPADRLADIFYHYGEIRQSRRLARKIKELGAKEPLDTTGRLTEVCRRILPPRGRINPATRVFQALRIAVNEELACLERSLPQAVHLLKPGGRVAVISYHSLEDRIVKHFFRNNDELEIITRKPLSPGEEEKQANPSSRSARLRAAVKRERD